MNKNEIIEFIKENYKKIYFTIVIYQLFLCVITFSQTNFKILMVLIFIFAGYIIIENWRSKSKND